MALGSEGSGPSSKGSFMNGLPAVAIVSEGEVVNEIPGAPWMYGIGALVILLVLLYVITRFNVDR
jgi:hypothetical protein